MKLKLSIIIPFYNTLELTEELLDILVPQLLEEIEIILVNDGSDAIGLGKYPIKIINTSNGGVSRARNIGLDYASGDYIAFIDSDDKVASNYIETILDKTTEVWDYCYISWEAKMGRFQAKAYMSADVDTDIYHGWWSPSVWSCIYKRELLENVRFNEKKVIAEDVEFSNRVRKGKRAIIKDVIYFYCTDRGDSLSDLFMMHKITEEYESLKTMK